MQSLFHPQAPPLSEDNGRKHVLLLNQEKVEEIKRLSIELIFGWITARPKANINHITDAMKTQPSPGLISYQIILLDCNVLWIHISNSILQFKVDRDFYTPLASSNGCWEDIGETSDLGGGQGWTDPPADSKHWR